MKIYTKRYIGKNIAVFVAVAVLYSLSFLFIAFSENKNQTSLYPAQYFQDTDLETKGLIPVANSIFTEISNIQDIRLINKVLVIIVFIYILWSSILFYKKNKKLIIIPISIIFFILQILAFVSLPPTTTIRAILLYAEKSLEKETYREDDNSIHDVEKIKSLLKEDKRKVKIVSGFGNYNVAVYNLTKNKSTNYALIFVPTAGLNLATEEGLEGLKEPEYQLYYYPETHSLVINNVDGLDEFIQFLSSDLISDIGNELLSSAIIEKGSLTEYKIVPAEEYSENYINRVKKNNLEEINDDLVVKEKNLKVIADCDKANAINEQLIESQKKDYQLNCVSRIRYRNCSEFKTKIDENVNITKNVAMTCRLEAEKAKKYNSDIDDYVKASLNNIDEVSTFGTLESNKAELSGGVFMQPSTIYLKSDYLLYSTLTTSVHEFLHFVTSKQDRNLPAFIDEGMTDHITGSAFSYNKYLSVAYSGYYAEMQILYSLLEKIPFDEMMRVYIEGDEKKFKTLFEKYFPNVSYDEFIVMSNGVFEETYKVKDSEVAPSIFNSRNYLWSGSVKKIRLLLGLEEYIWYSDLNNKF